MWGRARKSREELKWELDELREQRKAIFARMCELEHKRDQLQQLSLTTYDVKKLNQIQLEILKIDAEIQSLREELRDVSRKIKRILMEEE